MNAKNLFRMTEADEDPTRGNSPGVPPEGRAYPEMPRRPGMRRPRGPEGENEFDDPRRDIHRMMGGPGGPEGAPRGQFSPKEVSQLKDILILILAQLAHSDGDRAIGEALMNGQDLDPGALQHILDEARNINVPPSHGALLQSIFTKLQKG